ncbi:4-diphosphocytidyl-2-C-methyl-D-erythritol kinase [Sphingomonas jejuensis]|uniref:4-diphosphocytidyl-2-C-methyl-D-erythritol kinase n=1 Tax=Sphingomonas jejuensis TaxID=904715 RepID=A0ABX0XJX3_9SPHN|nr:4-(cytidine 5'-diphospho)-2-C-methyl-D-erythritol kinase [Sphingomonas jejuensis]NJC33643.1 4-diphosphocytidyl-2-C-methyl-D-erythritol kinase [Sphingomonas jejuensis]
MPLVETGYAKINLALHVRARRADGYHELETLFAFAADGDRLTAEPADDLSLRVDGPFAAGLGGDDDLVLRAARVLRAASGITAGARLHLTKQLPVAAGIGGGSADAAAALRLLSRLWSVEHPLAEIAAGLGADVPACVASRTVRGEGVGERLLPVPSADLSGLPLLLVNPGVPMPTGPVFAGWDGVDRGPLASGPPLAAAQAGRNDLAPPAMHLAPVIGDLTAALNAAPGIILARMSGSGATCFALFEDIASRDRAHAAVQARYPNAWCLATELR